VLALTCTRLSVRDPRSQFTTHPRHGSVPRPHRRPETTTDPTHDDVSRGRQTKSQVRNEPKSELPSLRKTKRRWHDLGRLGIKWGSHSTGYDRERVLQTRTGHLRHGTVVGRAEMISHSITHGFSFTLSSRLLSFVSWMTAESWRRLRLTFTWQVRLEDFHFVDVPGEVEYLMSYFVR